MHGYRGRGEEGVKGKGEGGGSGELGWVVWDGVRRGGMGWGRREERDRKGG